MDMTSITDLDMQLGDGKEDLESHLKDEDFFEVEKYPTGRFEIASVFETDSIPGATHMVIGNLTLKEVTKSVKVPARLLVNANHASAMTPSFKINRTEWGINFRSGILGGIAKDAVIEDMIELKLRVRGDLPNTSETVSE